MRFCAHTLNGIHHVALLRKKRVTEIGGPLDIVRQSLNHIGQRGHCLDTRIP